MDVMIISVSLCSVSYLGSFIVLLSPPSLVVQTSNTVAIRIMRQGYKCITAESFSNPTPTKRSSKQIVVQGDGDHDLCTNGLYAEATVMFTSIDVSDVEATANLHRRQSGRSTRRWCRDHYIGS